jgi:rhamnose transport system ATP-binding protein
VMRGSVHALVGENGAGKSTLGRMIYGVVMPDRGSILVNEAPASLRSPREALEHGVAGMSQESTLVPQLSVAENVFLGAEPRRASFIRRRALRRRYARLADSAEFPLPADVSVGLLRTADRQKVEILRALSRNAELIVMDEPTAALSGPERAHLHHVIAQLTRAGTTIIFVSHFLREVLDLADTVSVMRDGRIVHTAPTESETEDSLIRAMLGRPLGSAFPAKRPVPPEAPVVLSATNVMAAGVDDVSLEIRAGEIVGLAGLVGAGRSELARAIIGADRVAGGTFELRSGSGRVRNPHTGLEAGVAMIPESRTDPGLLLSRSVAENASLSSLKEVSRLGFVNRRAERATTGAVLERCQVRGASPTAPVASLSGGNQQKVLFARVLMCEPGVLIADEPTRGIDVGSKRAIYDLLVEQAADGVGVLLISSEVEEIIGLAHRVLVMRAGRVVTEFADAEMTEEAILAAAFGGEKETGEMAA